MFCFLMKTSQRVDWLENSKCASNEQAVVCQGTLWNYQPANKTGCFIIPKEMIIIQ